MPLSKPLSKVDSSGADRSCTPLPTKGGQSVSMCVKEANAVLKSEQTLLGALLQLSLI